MIEAFQKKHPVESAKSINELLEICMKEISKMECVDYVSILELCEQKVSKGHYTDMLMLDVNRQYPIIKTKNEFFSFKNTKIFRNVVNNKKSCICHINEVLENDRIFNRFYSPFKSVIVAPIFLKISTFVIIIVNSKTYFEQRHIKELNQFIQYILLKEQHIDLKNQSNDSKKLYTYTSIERIAFICRNLNTIYEKNDIELLSRELSKVINCNTFIFAIYSTESTNKITWCHEKSARKYDELKIEQILEEYISLDGINEYDDLMSELVTGYKFRLENMASMLICSLPWDKFQDIKLFYISQSVSGFNDTDRLLIELLRELFLRFLEGRWSDLAVYQAQNDTVMAQQAYLRLHDIRDYSTDINNVLIEFEKIDNIISKCSLGEKDKEKYINFKELIGFANRSQKKINELKTILQRTRSGQPLEEVTEFDLHTLLCEIVDYFKKDEHISNKKITFVIEDNINDKIVLTMKRFLEEALINIIKNAIFFSKKEQEIILKLYDDPEDNSFVNISIQDNGIPIRYPAKHLIFHPFYSTRAKDCVNDSSQGSGLGLFLSKVNMRMVGGDIFLSSVLCGDNIGRVNFILKFPMRLKDA